jgi:AraC-like DNA-binding protein
MSVRQHLILQERIIGPGNDWIPGGDGWMVIRVAEGAGYWLRAGRAGELNAGDGLIVGNDKSARLRSSQLSPMKLHFFSVQPEYLGFLTVEEWYRFKSAMEGASPYFQLFGSSEPPGLEFTRLAVQSSGNGFPARCDLLHFWAGAIAGFLRPASADGDSVSRLRERLRNGLAQMPVMELANTPAADLAQKLNCSLRHFRRLFREEFGIPFRTTQTELRLMHARQLLQESQSPVVAIASQCGYQHLSFFRSLFKKRFGIPPAEWRRQSRTSPAAGTHAAG